MQIHVQLKNKDHPTVFEAGEVDTRDIVKDTLHSMNGFLIIKRGDQVFGMFNIAEVAGWWLVEEDSKEKGEEYG